MGFSGSNTGGSLEHRSLRSGLGNTVRPCLKKRKIKGRGIGRFIVSRIIMNSGKVIERKSNFSFLFQMNWNLHGLLKTKQNEMK